MTCNNSDDRWQNGDCGAYAVVLRQEFPNLTFGALGVVDGDFFAETHHFVHDENFAYDSLGAHPMPYRGLNGDMDAEYGQDEWFYDEPHLDDVVAAIAHVRAHRTGPAKTGPCC